MYCPKCKKDIKPGSEKRMIHRTGLIFFIVGGCWLIFAPLVFGGRELVAAIAGGTGIVGGLIFGFRNRQNVCPACDAVLIPENPFSES